jgi:hypothetical protein
LLRGALLLAVGFLGASPAAAANLPLGFPVVFDAPTMTSVAGATGTLANPAVVYRQPVRSAGAARFTAEQILEYRPRVLDRKFAKGGVRRVVFPAGSIFVLALSPEGPLYCASGSDRAEGWLTFYDVGVCYRDTNGDQVFDERVLVEAGTRMRVPYEVLVKEPSEWVAVQTPYELVAPADIPAAELRVLYTYLDPPLGGPTLDTRLSICWAEALVLPDGKGKRDLCSATRWDNPILVGGQAYAPREKPEVGKPKPIGFGPLKGEFVARGGGAVDVTITAFPPPGQAVMVMAGFWRSTGDYRFQNSIFDFLTVKTLPALPAPGEVGVQP